MTCLYISHQTIYHSTLFVYQPLLGCKRSKIFYFPLYLHSQVKIQKIRDTLLVSDKDQDIPLTVF